MVMLTFFLPLEEGVGAMHWRQTPRSLMDGLRKRDELASPPSRAEKASSLHLLF